MSVAENVAKGVKFLDEHYPDWKSKLDWDKLDLASSTSCPGGQLEGDFFEFLRKHGLSGDDGESMGFDGINYSLLNEEWRKYAPKKNTHWDVIELLHEMQDNDIIQKVYGDRIDTAIEELGKTDATLTKIKEMLNV